MISTKINLVYDCNFNKEVSGNGALYWNNNNNSLCNTIKSADALSKKDINILSNNAINKIKKSYTWKIISNKYKNIFTNH